MAKKKYYLSVKSITALARNKRLRAAGYSVSAVIKNGSSSSINNNSSSGGSDVDLSKYVKFTDEATESKNGVLSTTDKTFIDALADIFIVIDADEGGEIQEGQVSLDDLSAFFKGLLFDGTAFTSAVESLGDKETEDWNNAEALQIWELNGFTALFGGAKILMNYANATYGGLMLSKDKVFVDLLNSYIVESNPDKDYKIPLDYLAKFFGEFLNDNVAFTSDPSAIGEKAQTGFDNAEEFQLWDFDGGKVLFAGAKILMNYANEKYAGLLKATDYAYIQWVEQYCVEEVDADKRGVPLKTLSRFFNELYNDNVGLWNGSSGGTIELHIYDFDGGQDLFPSIRMSLATTSNGGAMSATDKANLDNIYSAWQNSAGFLTSTEKSHYDDVYSAWQNSAGFITSTEKSNYDSVYSAWKNSDGFVMSAEDKSHLDEIYNAWKSGEL